MSERNNDERIETMVDELVGIGEAWLRTAGKVTGTAIEATGEGLRSTVDAIERLGTAVKEAVAERD
ncbi:MAG: hypothetical protein JRH16_01780 [Deltaproteobacteria bacterium]|nr:hypothetical protein [Deltaproteobacteria bacterium]MBW2359271.1 hypothetical protein [Deltaproteobacteria bacterium]